MADQPRAVTGGEHGGKAYTGRIVAAQADAVEPTARSGDGPARTWPAKGPAGRIMENMRRIIGTIVGAIVAVSLAVTSVGSIVATLKTFLIIGLIAMAVVIIVWLVVRRPRSAVRRD